MPNKHINIMLDPGAFMPEYAHSTDAGADLRSPVNITVPAHGSAVIDTGVHMSIPWHCAGMLKSKSGLNVKFNITSEGVIDPGYTGSIRAKLYNHGDKNFVVRRGDTDLAARGGNGNERKDGKTAAHEHEADVHCGVC